MLGLLLNRIRPIRKQTWFWLAVAALTLAIGFISSPTYAQSDDYTVGRYIDSIVKPKPRPTWEAIIAPKVAKVKADQAIAVAKAETARVAEEARQQEQQRKAAEVASQAVLIQPSQPLATAVVTGNCGDWMDQAGITDKVSALYIITRESGCNPNARGAHGGACGIGQQLPCGKWPHVWNDPVGGMIDMQAYVMGRYGSWANAVAYWQAHGNY